MFDDNDANEMANSGMRVPDGIINGTQYAEIFKSLSNILEDINPESYESNILWIMKCVNHCFADSDTGSEFSKDRAFDVVTALAYFSMTMTEAMHQLGVREDYFKHQNENVIPQLFSECETIPWYDFADEIKAFNENNDDNS